MILIPFHKGLKKMQRSSLKNNLKPMCNLIIAVFLFNIQILYNILSQTDFLPAFFCSGNE